MHVRHHVVSCRAVSHRVRCEGTLVLVCCDAISADDLLDTCKLWKIGVPNVSQKYTLGYLHITFIFYWPIKSRLFSATD